MVKVVVFGGGVIGFSAADQLARVGAEAQVVDRYSGPALETSLANAGRVSPGCSTPWAPPGIPWMALKRLCADRCQVVLSSRSPDVLKPLGVDLPVRPVKGYALMLSRLDECPVPVLDEGSKVPTLASTGAPGRRHGLARRVRAVVERRCPQALGDRRRRAVPRRHACGRCDTSATALHQNRARHARPDHGRRLGSSSDRVSHGAQSAYRPGRPRHRPLSPAWTSSCGGITSRSAKSRASAATIAYELLCNARRAPRVTDDGLYLSPVLAESGVDGT